MNIDHRTFYLSYNSQSLFLSSVALKRMMQHTISFSSTQLQASSKLYENYEYWSGNILFKRQPIVSIFILAVTLILLSWTRNTGGAVIESLILLSHYKGTIQLSSSTTSFMPLTSGVLYVCCQPLQYWLRIWQQHHSILITMVCCNVFCGRHASHIVLCYWVQESCCHIRVVAAGSLLLLHFEAIFCGAEKKKRLKWQITSIWMIDEKYVFVKCKIKHLLNSLLDSLNFCICTFYWIGLLHSASFSDANPHVWEMVSCKKKKKKKVFFERYVGLCMSILVTWWQLAKLQDYIQHSCQVV